LQAPGHALQSTGFGHRRCPNDLGVGRPRIFRRLGPWRIRSR
jgi:hypothetical protein